MSANSRLPDLPPKPAVRQDNVSFWQYLALFWRDILSAQLQRLYGAWMAEFRTPFFRSYLLNQPDLIKRVLKTQTMDFPKSYRIGAGLQPLLGKSVFLTNGAEWQRQRRIIDPAFQSGGVKRLFQRFGRQASRPSHACIRTLHKQRCWKLRPRPDTPPLT